MESLFRTNAAMQVISGHAMLLSISLLIPYMKFFHWYSMEFAIELLQSLKIRHASIMLLYYLVKCMLKFILTLRTFCVRFANESYS